MLKVERKIVAFFEKKYILLCMLVLSAFGMYMFILGKEMKEKALALEMNA